MKQFIGATLIACSSLFCVIGCTEKSTVTDSTKIKTPGGTTTISTEKEVKKTGDHKDDGSKPAATP